MREWFAYWLLISLGLIVLFAFLKPWLPEAISGVCLTAYEPNLGLRIFEGMVGFGVLCFGIERIVSFMRNK